LQGNVYTNYQIDTLKNQNLALEAEKESLQKQLQTSVLKSEALY